MNNSDETWEKINKNLKAYIDFRKTDDFYKFSEILKPINNIVLNQGNEIDFENKYINIMNVTEAEEISKEFFKSIDNTIFEKFNELINDKQRCDISKNEEKNMAKDGIMYVQDTNNLKTVYSLCHESIHIISNTFNKNFYYMLFGEINSLTFERLLNEFLEENNFKEDNNLLLLERINNYIFLAGACEFIEMVRLLFIKDGFISKENIKLEVDKLPNKKKQYIFNKYGNYYLNIILENKTANNIIYEKYILATVLSATLKNRINDDPNYLKEYLEKFDTIANIKNIMKSLDQLDFDFISNKRMLETLRINYNGECEKIIQQQRSLQWKKL